MPPRQSHLPQDRSTYIPPRIQQEMAKHMQQTLPANLQYYQKSGGYVPPHIQQQMAQHMQKSVPEHLKQYINPYMQQNVVSQHLASVPGGQPMNFTPHASPSFTPNQPLHEFKAHSQTTSRPQPTSSQAQSAQDQQAAAPEPQETGPPQKPYAFITNPEVAAKSSLTPLTMLNGKSMKIRIAALGGGLVVLLIIVSIFKGLVTGSFDLPPFVAVLQDQQELIHLTSTQSQSGQAALPATYQNFIATTQLTVTSAQTQLLAYLVKNDQKVSTAQLRYSASIDKQLTNATTNDTYVSTFQGIMGSQLNTYKTALAQAYAETSGKNGHTQLRSDYNQILLLIKQFNQASSVPSN